MNKAIGIRAARSALVCSAAISLMLGLTGCSSIGRALGMGKSPPDEFAVVTRAPLVIPPEFSLRPPEPGAPRPQEMSPDVQAQQTVFGAPPAGPQVAEGSSVGEAELLAKSGATRADPEIREQLEKDQQKAAAADDKSFGDRLLFWKGKPEPEAKDVIDPYGAGSEPAPATAASDPAPAPAAESTTPQPTAESSTPTPEAKSKGGFFSRIWPF